MQSKILFLPLSIILAVTLFIMFIKPDWDMYQNKKQDLAEMKQKSDDLNEKYDQAEKEMSKFNNLDEPSRKLIQEAVPGGFKEDSFVFSLSEIIDKNGVLFEGMSFHELRDHEKDDDEEGEQGGFDVEPIGLELSVYGDYLSVRKFIYALETMNRISNVKEVSFSVDENEEGEKLTQTGINFDIYKQDDMEDEKKMAGLFPSGKVWESIISEGFESDFVEKFREGRSGIASFDPDLSGAGKEDLFEDFARAKKAENNQENNTEGDEEPADEQNESAQGEDSEVEDGGEQNEAEQDEGSETEDVDEEE
ncbi:MAG: hypothetical protein R6V40_02820 [Candidatus Moraniibacteriota bacterium]